MAEISCYTSATLSYLPRARVLADTLRRHHPDWRLILCITDQPPAGFALDEDAEPFDEIIWTEDLPIPDVRAWLFGHDVVEACTAVKGIMLNRLLSEGADKVFYLDPDIAVLDRLDPVVDALDGASIALTPHQLEPETEPYAVADNELSSLRHGAFNLGFLGVRNDETGRAFASWWQSRLLSHCYDDIGTGLFVDQKWIDLVPAYFTGVAIVRDPGSNVASWNIGQRAVSIDRAGALLVNGVPLRFFHFTKLGHLADTMTAKYARDAVAVYELWAWYRNLIRAAGEPGIPDGWWRYGVFENGDPVPRDARVVYRQRPDLREAFTEPFETGPGTFHEWYQANA